MIDFIIIIICYDNYRNDNVIMDHRLELFQSNRLQRIKP